MPPALDGGVIEDGASVVATGIDARGGSPSTQVDGLGSILVSTADSELPVIVASPALHDTGVKQATRMLMTEGEGDDIGAQIIGCRRDVLTLVT